jgi:hypothetical protein
MHTSPGRFVLVSGTGFANAAKRRAARMVGITLAEAGLGLVTGNSTGVDRWVAEAFCGELAIRERPVVGAFTQVTLGGLRFFRRGGLPVPGYAAPAACRVRAESVEAWKREALSRSDAAVMIGGGRGALDIARRVIERGRPVFPLPFMGGLTGNSDFVFQEILRTWDSHPVPGVSRPQFLRLAEPWVSGSGPLANLLRGTLAEAPDIFVSYRRSDAPAAAGRLAHDLAEHFGQRRVFLDIHGIAPSQAWDRSIDGALDSSEAGIVVIGRNWLAPEPGTDRPRLHDEGDVVRDEIAGLLDPARARAVFPVLVEGARLPSAAELPEPLRPLLRFQATAIDNAGWGDTMSRLVREIEAAIRRADERRDRAGARPVDGGTGPRLRAVISRGDAELASS